MVSSTHRPHFTPGKDPVPILQEAGWAPGPVWTGGKSRPHRDSIPDRPARSQSLYRLSYTAHNLIVLRTEICLYSISYFIIIIIIIIIFVMELGHLLTRSCLTYPEVSSKVYHNSFYQLGSSISLPGVI